MAFLLLNLLFLTLVHAAPLEVEVYTSNRLTYDANIRKRSTVLAPLDVDRTGWVVSVDSFQAGNEGAKVIDGDPTTFWHTQFYPSAAGLPHSLTIDMGNSHYVNGMTYLPRQDGSLNGNIGSHAIYLSNDNKTWGTAVATGTYANDATLKTTYFTATNARYLLLTIFGDAQGDQNPWASAAEIKILQSPRPYLPRTSWSVSADSYQVLLNNNDPSYAIDGAGSTIWHTQYLPAAPDYPHYFTINQGSSVAVAGFSYLPRPPGAANGRIGAYSIQYSSDGSTWSTAASGTWPDTADLKLVEFASRSAQYWRLVAQSEAGNRGPWASAAEINLLDGSSSPKDFIITVDSEETASANNTGIQAADGDPATFWHTPWSSGVTALPHTFMIDMQSSFDVYGLTYLPRQDGSLNGNIGAYRLDVSLDSASWTTVSTGTFLDSNLSKTLNFGENKARYVRLTALSEAGGRGPWSSAAEITVMFSSGSIGSAASVGRWGQMIDMPLVPAAVAMLPNLKVVMWAAYDPLQYLDSDMVTTQTALFNPADGTVGKKTVTNLNHDMFCPGLSLDFDGRPIVTGGNTAEKTSTYDAPNDVWIAETNMNIARGYQASATLSDGRVFTIGGSWSGGTFKKPGEIYNKTANTWTSLPGCLVDPMLTNDTGGLFRSDNHAWLFAWKSNSIFQAGPSKAMNWYSPVGQGSYTAAGNRSSDNDAMNGNAVMYDAVNGKIFTVGGAPSYDSSQATKNAFVITLGAVNAKPSVVAVGSGMKYARAFHNSVVLPDGSIFIVGGQTFAQPFADDTSIFYPELWNPTTNSFTTLAPMRVPRVYHSVALLMPDGTVFSGGGGLCGDCDTNHPDAQIYSPPYLFNSDGTAATRPSITSMSVSKVRVGGSFQIGTSGGPTKFSMIRMGSATHTVDTDQRRIALTQVVSGSASGSFTITVPSDPGVALPGYWLVFALSGSVPSVGKVLLLTL